MKKISLIMLALSLLWGCKKDKSGTVVYTIQYSNSINKSMICNSNHKQMVENADTVYAQFGDYITSITPGSFIGKFGMIRFYNEIPITPTSEGGYCLDLKDNSISDGSGISLVADFSNNATVSATPTISGKIGSDGLYADKQVNFIILQLGLRNFRQIVTLPVQYTNITLSQFSDSVKAGNILSVDYSELISKLFNFDSVGPLQNIYFGNTNSTSINIAHEPQVVHGLEQVGVVNCFYIWSNHYNAWTFNAPTAGETRTIDTKIGFDYHNLIQIYAGADNIPYTSDDVFVYAPKFWERIYIDVTNN